MQSHLGHLLFNVQPQHLSFYRDLLQFMGWQVIYDGDGMLGVGGANNVSLWFGSQIKDVQNDYDGPGINHIALHVASQADVDAVTAYLSERGVAALFETPRHRPDFSADENSTYYQVMFETPDRVLVEVVYIGAKTA